MHDPVKETVREWAATPFAWGSSDCGMSVLAYAERVTGRTITVRPTHTSPRTAWLLLKLSGGFRRLAARVCRELALPETTKPGRGDIGLIDIPGQGLTMCLCLGSSWVAKGDRQILFIKQCPPVAAWKVTPCPLP